MPNIGPLELGIVLVIALIILGPKKLPDMGRSLGRGMREFKSAVTGDHDESKPELTEAEADEAKDEAGDDEHDEQPAERERERVVAAA